MVKNTSHSLLTSLLALALLIAPMQAAVSAIEMLDIKTDRTHHCQSDMGNTSPDMASHDGCCADTNNACQDNCASCSHCVSAYHAISITNHRADFSGHRFIPFILSLFDDITPPGEFHPPRNFS